MLDHSQFQGNSWYKSTAGIGKKHNFVRTYTRNSGTNNIITISFFSYQTVVFTVKWAPNFCLICLFFLSWNEKTLGLILHKTNVHLTLAN